MIEIALVVVGLCFGSFVNALVWRIHEQTSEEGKKKPSKKYLKDLSISKGRSMCPHCKHELSAKDLIPVLSWLSLRGKCRYCSEPISAQYPLVELLMAGLFVASYIWWPAAFTSAQVVLFGLWLVLLIGLVALLVYDFHWKLLPDRIMLPLSVVAATYAAIAIITSTKPLHALILTFFAVLIGGGIFYALFQLSAGKWIGGGDVKLGWLLGLVLGTPSRAVLMIFLAALMGSILSVPLLATNRLKRSSTIPFGPFLIIAAIIVQLFGHSILFWYQKTFLGFTV